MQFGWLGCIRRCRGELTVLQSAQQVIIALPVALILTVLKEIVALSEQVSRVIARQVSAVGRALVAFAIIQRARLLVQMPEPGLAV